MLLGLFGKDQHNTDLKHDPDSPPGNKLNFLNFFIKPCLLGQIYFILIIDKIMLPKLSWNKTDLIKKDQTSHNLCYVYLPSRTKSLTE